METPANLTPADRERLVQLLPLECWAIVWECFDKVQFASDGLERAVAVRAFLRSLLAK